LKEGISVPAREYRAGLDFFAGEKEVIFFLAHSKERYKYLF